LKQPIRRLGQKWLISNTLLSIASIVMSEENYLSVIRSVERQESRLERKFHWLITWAALASLAFGILCLAKFATPPTTSFDQERLAGRESPTQSIVTFGQAFQQLGARR
jgi:hypothetical protein